MSQNRRETLAFQYLQGRGLEIGALHNPLKTGPHAHVSYVDRMPVEELREHYPELADLPLVTIDHIDDGEKLLTIPDASQDFIIANHMLEHCENPLATLRQHFAKLKPGGLAYYAIPNKHFTFDQDREYTSFEHIMFDDQIGPEGSREQHFREVVEITEKYKGEKAVKRLNKLMEIHYSIHCHVWDQRSFRQFLVRANDYLDNVFTIVDYVNNGDEIICILVNEPDPQLSFEMEKIMAQVKFDEKLSRFCRQLSWRRWPVFWFWWERMCHEKLWPTFKRWAGAIPSKWKQNRSYLILNNACRRMLGQRAVEK